MPMPLRGPGDRQDQLLQELAEERFAALTRIARTLEVQIDQLRSLRRSLTTLNEPGREQTRRAYRELRTRALRQRWYMDVQREVVGLRPHALVDEFYEVPGPID
jgi:hypothetical protein